MTWQQKEFRILLILVVHLMALMALLAWSFTDTPSGDILKQEFFGESPSSEEGPNYLVIAFVLGWTFLGIPLTVVLLKRFARALKKS